jgi:hypothetical protein
LKLWYARNGQIKLGNVFVTQSSYKPSSAIDASRTGGQKYLSPWISTVTRSLYRLGILGHCLVGISYLGFIKICFPADIAVL